MPWSPQADLQSSPQSSLVFACLFKAQWTVVCNAKENIEALCVPMSTGARVASGGEGGAGYKPLAADQTTSQPKAEPTPSAAEGNEGGAAGAHDVPATGAVDAEKEQPSLNSGDPRRFSLSTALDACGNEGTEGAPPRERESKDTAITVNDERREKFDLSDAGLSDAEVEELRKTYGFNEVRARQVRHYRA